MGETHHPIGKFYRRGRITPRAGPSPLGRRAVASREGWSLVTALVSQRSARHRRIKKRRVKAMRDQVGLAGDGLRSSRPFC